MDKGIAKRQAALRHLHHLADLGVLSETPVDKEQLLIHPKLMQLIDREDDAFLPHDRAP